MGVNIRRTIPDLTNLPLLTRAEMREVGLLAIERIRRRTVAGKDVQGQAFRPYSPEYQKRKAQEVGGATPNLQLSGAMLNALTILDVTDTSVTIGFSS